MTKRYRVVQWATGVVGSSALRSIVRHPRLELAGVKVYSDAKAGRDAGEIVGIDPTGVIATQDVEEIVALDPLDGEALILLGKHASRNDETERAIFYFERAESLEAFEADAKVAHAQLLVSQSKYDQAVPMLKSAQSIKPRENVQRYLEQVERIARR